MKKFREYCTLKVHVLTFSAKVCCTSDFLNETRTQWEIKTARYSEQESMAYIYIKQKDKRGREGLRENDYCWMIINPVTLKWATSEKDWSLVPRFIPLLTQVPRIKRTTYSNIVIHRMLLLENKVKQIIN